MKHSYQPAPAAAAELLARSGRSVLLPDPPAGGRTLTREQMLAWLTDHVRIDEEGCRIWAGPVARRRGTPVVYWNRRRYSARRLLWELSGRPLRASHLVYTSCGSARCMDLEHLRAGTRNRMMKALADRGAFLSGVPRSMASAVGRAAGARLPITERDAVMRLRAQGASYPEIGLRYGVSKAAVSHAVRRWDRILGTRLVA